MSPFSVFNWLGARPYWLSSIFTLLLVAWMASGAGEKNEPADKPHKKPLVTVQVTSMKTQPVLRSVTLYGRTEPSRQTTVKAEVSGLIDKVFARRGARISTKEKIARIEVNDKKLQLAQARSLLRQREIEYKGSLSLSERGYQGKVRLAEAEAARDLAKALVNQLELAVENTHVKSPYNGVLTERHVELGDYVGIGDPIATITDIDPLVVRTNATERDIRRIQLGQKAYVTFVDDIKVQGMVRYISSISDLETNTFKVEVEVPNPDHKLLAGLSARTQFPLEEVQGLQATPAILAIADDGTLGVKTVEQDIVVFTPIKLISSDKEGVWLSGFDHAVDVITVGQGFVRPGDKVKVVNSSDIDNREPKS